MHPVSAAEQESAMARGDVWICVCSCRSATWCGLARTGGRTRPGPRAADAALPAKPHALQSANDRLWLNHFLVREYGEESRDLLYFQLECYANVPAWLGDGVDDKLNKEISGKRESTSA